MSARDRQTEANPGISPSTDSETNETEKPGPAGNALKHGFCASKILSAETLALSRSIREDLLKAHDPWSREEAEAVEQLAIARAQQFELERALHLKITEEKARARELFERAALDTFAADLARARENPSIHAPLIGLTWHGADWLCNLWGNIADDLAPDLSGSITGIAFQAACDCSLALGSAWQVDRAGSASAWFMARYVRIAPDPLAAIELWVDRSKAPDGRAFALARARRLVDKVPVDAAIAAAEVIEKAKSECSRWSLQARKLRADYETALARAAETAVGTGAGDAKLEKEFRLLHRYLTSARNRGDRLERRLDQLKKDRKRLAYRLQRDAEREARRLKAASAKAMNTFERESPASAPYPSAAYSIAPEYPVNTGWQSQSCEWDDQEEARNRERLEVQSKALESHSNQAAAVRSISPQVSAVQKDDAYFRNGFRAAFGLPPEPVSNSVPVEVGRQSISASESGSESGFDWLDASAPLETRLRMMRFRDWSNPAAIPADEAEILRRLAAMPDSPDRDLAAQKAFGSVKKMKRCLRALQSWASPGA
ncbi:hypothetical protein GC170_17155 [bacterium]|nr:hypothetical protein [bacterium]